jgi:hypothetical protein
MCNLLDCPHNFLVKQLTIILLLLYLSNYIYFDQSSYSSDFGSSRDCIRMPVLTRSMMKCGLQPSLSSAGLLTCPTCYTDGTTKKNFTSTESSSITSSSSLVPELLDQCNSSSSSSQSDDSSIMSSDDEFEISNFEIFEIPDCTPERSIPQNLEITRVSKMESDCKESGQQLFKTDNGSSNQDNIMQMLNLISTKMMDTIQDLQCQMVQNNLKFTAELQKISQENETFRQAVTADVQRLSSMTNTLPPVSVVPSTIPISGSMSLPALIIPSSGASSVVPSSTSPQDFQQQKLSMLNDTFSKLTTVMTESKSSDSKADWPKFNGDTKKFKHWHLAIIAQLSLAPWKELYDPTTNTLLKTTPIQVLMRNYMPRYYYALKARSSKIWLLENILGPMDSCS